MKTKLNKILSIFMAFFVMLSTTSFAVETQFCKNALEDVSFNHQPDCCKAKTNSDNNQPSNTACHDGMNKDNCCSVKQISNEGQNQVNSPVNEISLEHHIFLSSFIYTYFHLIENYNNNSTCYRDYIPPLIIREVYKVKEVYLI